MQDDRSAITVLLTLLSAAGALALISVVAHKDRHIARPEAVVAIMAVRP